MLTGTFGECISDRIEAAAARAQKQWPTKLSPKQAVSKALAGDAILAVLTDAPGNSAAIGRLKVITEHGWFAVRPCGTEDIYKICVESFRGEAHLLRIASGAQAIIDPTLSADASTT